MVLMGSSAMKMLNHYAEGIVKIFGALRPESRVDNVGMIGDRVNGM
jgi:hypothetical protein